MKKGTKFISTAALISLASLSITGCQFFQPKKIGQLEGTEYTITIKNGLAKEKFAPILVVSDADDSKIWVGKYVSPEARTQFTTGNPIPLSKVLGHDQGLPGGIKTGKESTFTFRTKAKTARITAMVHPDFTPDNYVTAKVDLKKGTVVDLKRYDIGDNENRKTVEFVSDAGTVTVE